MINEPRNESDNGLKNPIKHYYMYMYLKGRTTSLARKWTSE